MVPNVAAPNDDQDYYSAIWIGIDGLGSPESADVCQVGINCDVTRHGTSISSTFYPWWEWYQESVDTGEVSITNLPVSPGDTIGVVICTAGAGATEATVFFTNLTSGMGTSFVMEAEAGVSLVGNTAEWIVERPTVDGQPSLLADYGEVFFSGCDAVSYSSDGSISEVVGGGNRDLYRYDRPRWQYLIGCHPCRPHGSSVCLCEFRVIERDCDRAPKEEGHMLYSFVNEVLPGR
jgi:Peptidase A4 family